jgi:uncharacterized protein GlcG (DUF336 family)
MEMRPQPDPDDRPAAPPKPTIKETPVKKTNKIAAAAAAGALLLTGGLTAAANAGTSQGAAQAAVPAPAAVSGVVPAADIPQSAATVVTQNRITVGASADAVRAALAKCQADKLPFVTVALVDRFGAVQALLRGDNAAEHTIEAAKQKAYTAAAFGTPTSELAKRINGTGPGIADLPGTLFLAGGVPLKVNGVSVAGIGVGGAPDGTLDEACANAGAEAIAAAAAGSAK